MIRIPSYETPKQPPSLLSNIGNAVAPIFDPIKQSLEAPWLGRQGVLPQFVGRGLQEATAGWIKPDIDEPETMDERVAAAAGSMLGFGIPLGKIGKVTKMKAVGEALQGGKVLKHLQLDHAIPAAIYGFVKETGMPFGSPEDMDARRKNAISTGAMIGGLSMATKFTQARLATRLMDAALPKLQENPALRSMVTNFMTNMGIGAGLGFIQPEEGLDRGTSAVVGGLGFGIGGAIGGAGTYKEVQKQAKDFRDNLIKSGSDPKEADRIINKFYDGKIKLDELRNYNSALKAAKSPEDASKLAAGISIKTTTQYGEKVGQAETEASAKARLADPVAQAQKEAEAKQKAEGGDNKQTEGKIILAGEAAKVKEKDRLATIDKELEAQFNASFGKGAWTEKRFEKLVNDIRQQALQVEGLVPPETPPETLASIRAKIIDNHVAIYTQPDIQQHILKASLDDAVNTVYPDVNWETTDGDVAPLREALDAKDKGNHAPLKIIVEGKKKQKELEKKARAIERKRIAEEKKRIEVPVKQVQKAVKGKWVQTPTGIKYVLDSGTKQETRQAKQEVKNAKTEVAISKAETAKAEKAVKDKTEHTKNIEKAAYNEGEEAKGIPEDKRTLQDKLKEIKVDRVVKAGGGVYVTPEQKGYEVKTLGGPSGTPGTTDIDKAIRFAFGPSGKGVVYVLRGDKIGSDLKVFDAAQSAYKGKINVTGEMNVPGTTDFDYFFRSEGDVNAPLGALSGVIIEKGSPEFEKWVNIINYHNKIYPDDPMTMTIVRDPAKLKIKYVADDMDIRDLKNKNILDSLEDRRRSEYSARGEGTLKLTEQVVFNVNRIIQTPNLYNREREKVTELKWSGLPELGGTLKPVKPVKTLGDAIERGMEEAGYRDKGKSLEEQKAIILAHVRKYYDRNDLDLDTTTGKIKTSFKKVFAPEIDKPVESRWKITSESIEEIPAGDVIVLQDLYSKTYPEKPEWTARREKLLSNLTEKGFKIYQRLEDGEWVAERTGKTTRVVPETITLDKEAIPMEVPELTGLKKALEEFSKEGRAMLTGDGYSFDKHTSMNDKLFKEIDKLITKQKGTTGESMDSDSEVRLVFMRGLKDDATGTIKYIDTRIEELRNWLAPITPTGKGAKVDRTDWKSQTPGRISVRKGGKEIGSYYKRKAPFKTSEYDLRATAGLEPSERTRQGELKALYAQKSDIEAKLEFIQQAIDNIESYRMQEQRKANGMDVDAETQAYFDDMRSRFTQGKDDSRVFDEEAKGDVPDTQGYGTWGSDPVEGFVPDQTYAREFKFKSNVVFTDAKTGETKKFKADEKISITKDPETKNGQHIFYLKDGVEGWVTFDALDKVTSEAQAINELGEAVDPFTRKTAKEQALSEDWKSTSMIDIDKFEENLKLTPEEGINRAGASNPDAVNFSAKEQRNATTAMMQEGVNKGKEISETFDALTKGMGTLDKMDVADDILKAMHEMSVQNPSNLMQITRSEYGLEELKKGTSAWDRLSPELQKFTAQLKATYKAMAQVLIKKGLMSEAVWDESKEGYAHIAQLDPQGNLLSPRQLFARGIKTSPLKTAKYSYERNIEIAKAHRSRLLSDPGKLFSLTVSGYAKALGNDYGARTLEGFKDIYGRPALAFSKDIDPDNMKYYISLESGAPDTRGLTGIYKRYIGNKWEEPYVLRDLDKDLNPTSQSATARWMQALVGSKGGELMLHPAVNTYARIKGLLKQVVLTNPTYITWQAYNSFVPVLGPFGSARAMFKHAGFKNYRNFEEMKDASMKSGLRVGDEILRAMYDDFVSTKEGEPKNRVSAYLDTIEKNVKDKYTLREKLFGWMESAAVQAWELQRARFERGGMDPKRAGVVAAEAINLAMGTPDKTAFDGFTNFATNMFFLARNNQVSAIRMLLGSAMAVNPEARLKDSQMFGFHGYTPQERKALGQFFATQMGWQLAGWVTSSALISYFMSGAGAKKGEMGLLEGVSGNVYGFKGARNEDLNKALMIHTGIKRKDGSEVLIDAPIFKDARDMLQMFTGPQDYLKNKMDPTLKMALELLTGGQILPGEKGYKPFSEPGTPIPQKVLDVALKKFFGYAGITKPFIGAMGGQEFINKYGNLYPQETAQEWSNVVGLRQGMGVGGVGRQGAAVRAGIEAQKGETLARTNMRNEMLNAYIGGNDLKFNNLMIKLYPDSKVRARALKDFKLKMSNPAAYQLKKWKDAGPAETAYYDTLRAETNLGI